MKCSNCQEKIDPKYKHALSENICPACGKSLLSGELYKFKIEILHILGKEEISAEEAANEIVDIVRRKSQKAVAPAKPNPLPKTGAADRKTRIEHEVDNAIASGSAGDEEVVEEDEVVIDPNNPDGPMNAEEKEFLESMEWAGSSTSDELEAKKKAAKGNRYVPQPIGRK